MEQRSVVASKGFRALLVTQFLGAFNDNAFRWVVLLAAAGVAGTAHAGYKEMAAALFALPFLLFPSVAGYLADRYSKRTVMIWSKVAEIAVMLLGGMAFFFGGGKPGILILVVVFLMGAQSTFFSPAKYGILPEVLPEAELSMGNGLIQMWTFLAVILGSAASGFLVRWFSGRLYVSALVFVAIAAIGTYSSFSIPRVPAAGKPRRLEINFLRSVWRNLGEIRHDRPLFLCIQGTAYFWFLGALFQLNLTNYAPEMMGITNQIHTGLLLTAVAVGIGAGSVLAGRWSEEHVEFGLVPLGAAGLGFLAMGSAFSYHSTATTVLLLVLLGVSAGLYNIPLAAYIQQKSPTDSKGRILATSNFLTFTGILLASPFLWFLRTQLDLNPAQIFFLTGVTSLLVLVYICTLVPDFLLRFLIWLASHTFYRIRIVGKDHLPSRGGALLICNHVSYIDGFLVQGCTQRFIRFFMVRQFYDIRYLRPFCKILRAIPVSAQDGPRKLQAAFDQAREDLRRGELVCLFAEGAITRTGNLLPFSRAMEVILEGVDVPVIPVHLDRVWGSIFSFEGGRPLSKWPAPRRAPVTISFGDPMPASSTAFEIRGRVEELGAEAFRYREGELDLLPVRFLRRARKHPGGFCLADSGGTRLGAGKAAIGALALARAVKRTCRDDEMVGILLPNSVPAALLNVSLSLLGKIPVNLNFTASTEALDKAIERCEIRHIFTAKQFLEKARLEERPGMVFMEDFKEEVTSLDKALAAAAFWLSPPRCLGRWIRGKPGSARDLATVIFSSGSTGDPKGVMLSHANINANVEGIGQILDIAPDDAVLGILPLFHSFGFTGGLWLPLISGAAVVYHHNPLDVKTIGELAGTYGITIVTATPTFLMGFIRRCTPEQFASLRYVMVGAEKLKDRIATAFEKKFGVEPFEGYGCTELSPVVSLNIPDVDRGKIHQTGRKRGTIGHPLPGVAVRIVDPDTFEPLGPGQDGLLLVKGPNVMLGYLKDEDRTREVMRGDWYVTGDIATLDRDGFITIKDRLSRFSKIGGEMVPHIRIEEEIHTLLNAGSEQLCAVTSVPDERKGEALAVLVLPSVDVDELLRQLGESELPKLWIPRRNAFVTVDEIPILGTGKLDLRRIKGLAAEALAGESS